MSVIAAELLLYASAGVPDDDADALGGAIDLANQIIDGDFSKVYANVRAEAGGGSDLTIYGKAHLKNTNAADDLTNATIFIKNALDAPTITGTIKITTVAAGDDDRKCVKIIGKNAAGNYVEEDVTLPAVPGDVFSTTSFLLNEEIWVGLYLLAADLLTADVLTTAAGDITLTRGAQELGIIPEGAQTASGLIDIGLAAALDDATTAANRLTAPAGIVFSRAKDDASALDVANAGTLTANTNQAIWFKLTLKAGLLPIEKLQLGVFIDGDAT